MYIIINKEKREGGQFAKLKLPWTLSQSSIFYLKIFLNNYFL